MPHQNKQKKITQINLIKPNKLLGQNFLRDKNILRKIITAANLTSNDTVLEVGPGEGTLTEELAKVSGQVIAVEKDRALAAQLKIKFADIKNVQIIEDDILEFVNRKSYFARLASQAKRVNLPYKVVANIPYYLTSHLIRLLLEADAPPQDIVLMIQKEVAQRICAKPPKMSLLSAAAQFYAQPKIIAVVPRGAFWPRPKVDSAIIKLVPHFKYQTTDKVKFFKALHAGFSQPRKQLLNNLTTGLKIPRQEISELLADAGLKPNQRAETLSLDDWSKIANWLKKKNSLA